MNQSPFIENKSQLIEYLASGCKPKSQWKVGTEHEKFGFHTHNLKPLGYFETGGIRDILIGLRDKFNWLPQYENDNIIALVRRCSGTGTLPPLFLTKKC